MSFFTTQWMAENSVYKEPPNFYSYWVKTMRTVITFQ